LICECGVRATAGRHVGAAVQVYMWGRLCKYTCGGGCASVHVHMGASEHERRGAGKGSA
jgi:hypothetical protein